MKITLSFFFTDKGTTVKRIRHRLTSPSLSVSWVNTEPVGCVFVCVLGWGGGGGEVAKSINAGDLGP